MPNKLQEQTAKFKNAIKKLNVSSYTADVTGHKCDHAMYGYTSLVFNNGRVLKFRNKQRWWEALNGSESNNKD